MNNKEPDAWALCRGPFREAHERVLNLATSVRYGGRSLEVAGCADTQLARVCYGGMSRRPSQTMPQAGKSYRNGVARFTERDFVFSLLSWLWRERFDRFSEMSLTGGFWEMEMSTTCGFLEMSPTGGFSEMSPTLGRVC